MSQTATGDLVGRCPKMPSDLDAKVGVHVDNQNPSQKEKVFGYVHLKTTDLNLCMNSIKIYYGEKVKDLHMESIG